MLINKVKILIEYLFNIKPLNFTTWGASFIASALVAMLLYSFIKIFFNKIPVLYRKTIKKIQNILIWYGIISAILYFLRIQRIPYLSMRIWLWLWVVSILTLAALSIVRELGKIPQRQAMINQEIKNKQYFNN